MSRVGKLNDQKFLERLHSLPDEKIRKVEEWVEHLSRKEARNSDALAVAYREMAADQAREQEAMYWIEASVDDALDDLSKEKHGNQR